ncbi:ribbon-helix-helix protein, CopG family [Cochleicola gelatinilyticus]|uniref:CopG family transcriptional regulator n=1 Tax=Cochleicola gelatinilyticus TaxID=1763537 RepID=A0A167IIX6_9FLAO|nr:ribbon-helix-helix protein, CopG family [Cochleicola gelatinilyticus]OAB79700.1 CopG family transcriptional regulator [Cochleicola gelatinilyticus]
MATFTSSLPDEVLDQLAQAAKDLKLPKNKIIERALSIYLEQLDRAAYAKSYKKMANDPDMLAMAEEGMETYCRMLNEADKE